MLSRTLVSEKRYDDAMSVLEQALAIQERAYGPTHPRVASVLNAMGIAAEAKGDLDVAERDFTRMRDIYRTAYGERHYTLGIAASDLGSVYQKRADYPRAERYFRDALERLTAAQGADHLNTGIVRIKLGEALLAEHRYDDARRESVAGYEIVAKQGGASDTWLATARKDIAAESLLVRR
jgi:eukaryotic-like serine/threonine-protein kinase